MNTRTICEKSLAGEELSFDELVYLLNTQDEEYELLREYARTVRKKFVGDVVHLRGLIEFSNICTCDCRYCGIRKSNHNVNRYSMSCEDILSAADFSWKSGYGSVVLQSGERRDSEFVDFVSSIVKSIKKSSRNELGITLSCGVQSIETYRKWKDAGADRYLLRIETTNRELFRQLHIENNFDERIAALNDLKSCRYITGTGVMTGLPNQTVEMLAQDIMYFKTLGADMIGLGPYITHRDAVLEEFGTDTALRQHERLMFSYKMIAVCRLVLKNVNIAAATALSALDEKCGRLEGLNSGANVIMPNTGDKKRRKDYDLYANKPDTGEALERITEDIKTAKCELELFTQGNPPRVF